MSVESLEGARAASQTAPASSESPKTKPQHQVEPQSAVTVSLGGNQQSVATETSGDSAESTGTNVDVSI